MYTYWNNVRHPAFCVGCEACQPTTIEQREQARFAAQERVAIKRALRRALAKSGIDTAIVTVR